MKVKTLLGNDFSNACVTLSEKVANDFSPNIIIGVLTGGGHVGQKMYAQFNSEKCIYTEIKIQRESSKNKENGLFHKLLQTLPLFLLNWLRMLEMLYEDYMAKKKNPKREGRIEFDQEIINLLKSGEQKVLIVDDAIDTGATLNLLKEHINEHYPKCEVKLAVITVTSNHPIVDADYCLYHDRTLVRFPWSNDVKQKK